MPEIPPVSPKEGLQERIHTAWEGTRIPRVYALVKFEEVLDATREVFRPTKRKATGFTTAGIAFMTTACGNPPAIIEPSDRSIPTDASDKLTPARTELSDQKPELFTELSEEEDPLKEDIENRFGVKLLTYQDQIREQSRNSFRNANDPYVLAAPGKWNRPRLQMLEGFLESLPPYLYKLGFSEYTLKIVLTPGIDQAIQRPYDFHHNYINVELNYEDFVPSNEYMAFRRYVHENIHALDMTNARPDYLDTVTGKIDLHKKIKSILGYNSFGDFSQPLFWKAVEKINQINQSDLPRAEKQKKIYDYSELAYGFGKPGIIYSSPKELIAILSQLYLDGKEEFTTGRLSEFFDPQTIEELYNFVKYNIFDEREYLKE